jgi:hypothetical protein
LDRFGRRSCALVLRLSAVGNNTGLSTNKSERRMDEMKGINMNRHSMPDAGTYQQEGGGK